MIAPEIIDRDPITDDEVEERRILLRKQLREVRSGAFVACPCDAVVTMERAYKCRECGVYFCGRCADRHFGLARVDPLAEMREEVRRCDPEAYARRVALIAGLRERLDAAERWLDDHRLVAQLSLLIADAAAALREVATAAGRSEL